jgi:hypothetical protein
MLQGKGKTRQAGRAKQADHPTRQITKGGPGKKRVEKGKKKSNIDNIEHSG